MKIFISGPITDKPGGNKEVFFKAEYRLKRLGYSVFNPAWCQYGVVTEFTKDDMHSIDFAALNRCDAIYMLKGWQYSIGARAEYEHAKALGKEILREGDPITDPLKYGKYDWESWKNKLPDSLDSKKIDSLEKWRNDFAECYTVNITNLRKEVEAIKESIGTDNLQEQLEKDFADVYEEFQNTKDQVNDIEYGYIDWSSKMSSAIDEMEKVKKTVKGLNSLVATLGERNGVLSDNIYELQRIIISSDIKNISIKAMNQKLIDLGRELDDYKEADEALEKCIKDMNERMSLFGRELDAYEEAYKQLRTSLDNNDNALERRIKALEKKYDELNHSVGVQGKEIGGIIQRRCDDNQVVNNMLNDINIRLKALEKRFNIKPFYAPTEDEKDDD